MRGGAGDKSGVKAADKTPDFAALLAQIKGELGEAVREVRLSKTLTDSVACLVADEQAMDIQMERLIESA